MATKPRLSVLVPVYNEGRTLRQIAEKVLRATDLVDIELVIVDDASGDDSREIIQELAGRNPNVKYHFQERNGGKGAAVRQALAMASGEWVIIQDADLEYDPADYARLLAPALSGQADAVLGSRFAASASRRVLYFWHSVANRLLTTVTNVLNDLTVTDMETCYKLVRADILKMTPLRSRSFDIEPELVTRLAQWKARIYEVPVSYHGRTYAEGKHIRFRHALQALLALFYYRFVNTRFTDHDGLYILDALSRAKGFNRMLMRKIAPFLGGRVLEAGCGIGNLTSYLLDRKRLIAVDREAMYAETVSRRFGHLANVRALTFDLADPAGYEQIADEKLDTVLCMNVLEHIERDTDVLRHFAEVLEPGGHVVCLVPQHQKLYSPADATLGHFRRYSEEELSSRMRAAGLEVVALLPFNRMGVLGWWANGRIFRRKTISAAQIRTYELMMPLARVMEMLSFLPALSLIAVGRRN